MESFGRRADSEFKTLNDSRTGSLQFKPGGVKTSFIWRKAFVKGYISSIFKINESNLIKVQVNDQDGF